MGNIYLRIVYSKGLDCPVYYQKAVSKGLIKHLNHFHKINLNGNTCLIQQTDKKPNPILRCSLIASENEVINKFELPKTFKGMNCLINVFYLKLYN